MFSKHVNKELSAYCHGELSAEEARRVAEHLIGCNRCRPEFEEIKFGVKLAERLPQVTAPDSLWADLQVRLTEQSQRSEAGAMAPTWRRLTPVFLLQSRFVAGAAVVVLAISLGLVWLYKREARPSWDVASLKGRPRIGASGFGEKGKLGVGQWLETDSTSSAQIEISSIGQVEIDPNTRVRLVGTSPTEHRL